MALRRVRSESGGGSEGENLTSHIVMFTNTRNGQVESVRIMAPMGGDPSYYYQRALAVMHVRAPETSTHYLEPRDIISILPGETDFGPPHPSKSDYYPYPR